MIVQSVVLLVLKVMARTRQFPIRQALLIILGCLVAVALHLGSRGMISKIPTRSRWGAVQSPPELVPGEQVQEQSDKLASDAYQPGLDLITKVSTI